MSTKRHTGIQWYVIGENDVGMTWDVKIFIFLPHSVALCYFFYFLAWTIMHLI